MLRRCWEAEPSEMLLSCRRRSSVCCFAQTDSEEYANAKAKVTELETEIKALTTAVGGPVSAA